MIGDEILIDPGDKIDHHVSDKFQSCCVGSVQHIINSVWIICILTWIAWKELIYQNAAVYGLRAYRDFTYNWVFRYSLLYSLIYKIENFPGSTLRRIFKESISDNISQTLTIIYIHLLSGWTFYFTAHISTWKTRL